MKKIKFIYNPFSGENHIVGQLDNVIRIHQKYGYTVVPFRISRETNLEDAFNNIDSDYRYILVAGGDGTVDTVVNVMKRKNIDIPIAILPSGTANDFAKFIGMPTNVSKACEQILNSQPKKVDLGKINDKYFVNVASTGLFTDISQKTDVNLKNTIGKLAYYIKGLEQVPNLRKLKVRIESEDFLFDDYMYLVLIFNGRTAGNFNLAYNSDVDDGLLDVIIFEGVKMANIINIFIKILKGEHLENVKGVTYYKTKNVKIYSDENIVTDIDGEKGPDFPIEIQCLKDGLTVLGYTR
ncbi:YegS/Rv2252/BmrU family lipid kinase [Hathewaya limosa]|uniref:YegS/Rv2252/BmrU family lipid kinase n=1 Tax=Hathewaya limosa TaxID=1536 RepID=A0ABU0JWU5_HATLI|nr:YegS/Rv2252/BmrU family lipid kinase [Hathewaya limosa]MDQ0480623.1 YegS/Rv2252/BmrU family lipid kinase [Hathewaya limosa]